MTENLLPGELSPIRKLHPNLWLIAFRKPKNAVRFSFRLKEAVEKLVNSSGISVECDSGAKAGIASVGFMRGLKPPPPSGSSYSAGCNVYESRIQKLTPSAAKAALAYGPFTARLKPCPFKAHSTQRSRYFGCGADVPAGEGA